MTSEYNKISSKFKIRDKSLVSHPYIPSPINYSNISEVLHNKGIIDLYQHCEYRICDIGFGLGDKLFQIKESLKEFNPFNKVYYYSGIEYDNELINYFNQNLKPFWYDSDIEIYNQDASKFQDYSKFDLILTWRVLKSEKNVRNFHNFVLDEMKSGSIFIEDSNLYPLNLDSDRYKRDFIFINKQRIPFIKKI